MKNKVIAKEYVDKNYIHKDVLREILINYDFNYDFYLIQEKLKKLVEDK